MKREQIERKLTTAETIIRRRRFTCAQMAYQVLGAEFERQLREQGAFSIFQITGATTLNAARPRWATKLKGTEQKARGTAERYWRETLPVLHLALTYYGSHEQRLDEKEKRDSYTKYGLVLDDVLNPQWLESAVSEAELQATDLAACRFDPRKRIRIAKK